MQTVQDVINKFSKGKSKAGGLTCDQLLRRAEEKEARAEKLARTNAPKAAAAEAAARREYEKDLQRATEEAKRAAHAAGVAYACATKPAKRRVSKAKGPIAAAAAPRKAVGKKTPKRAAKKAPKKSSKRGAAKKTAKRGGKKTSKAGKRGMAKMDRKLLNAARRAVKGQGDGRISLADAHKMMRSIIDNKDDRNDYTDKEKATMEHIRQNFSFTPEADEWMRHQIASHGARQAHRAMGHTVKAPKAPKAKRASKKASAKKAPKAKRAAKAAAPKKQAKKVGARGGRRKVQPTVVVNNEKGGTVIVDTEDDTSDDEKMMQGLKDVVGSVMKDLQGPSAAGRAANEGLPRRGRKSSKPNKVSRRRRDVIEGCPSPSRGGHIPSGY